MVPPYTALDFDLNVSKGEVTTPIGKLKSLKHLANYGRPMYAVLFSKDNVTYTY